MLSHRLRPAIAAVLAVMAVLAALTSACGGDKPLSAPVSAKTTRPGNTDRVYKVKLKMRVSGAQTINLERRTSIHVVEIHGENIPQAIAFLSVSTNLREPLQLADGRYLQYDADLSPGIYRGPGTYTLSLTPGTAVGGQGLSSAAYVLFFGKGEGHRYDRLTSPCTMRFERDAREGEVDCPKLGDAEGAAVAVHWSWERI